ncbi:MAG: hypothetical protein ACREUW_03640 [Burkholderiales bacterium]
MKTGFVTVCARPSAVLLALLVTGCAAYTPRFDQAARPAATDAFIYGRFAIDSRSTPLALDGHNTMGFTLQCRDGSSYLLRFYNANPLHVIKVQPSTCSVTETVFSNADGIVRSRKPYTGSLLQNIELKAGTGYYVGDYFAVAGVYSSGYGVTTTWRVVDAKANYTRTTSDMKTAYAGLKELRTEDLTRRQGRAGELPEYPPNRSGSGTPADMLDELPLP